MAAGYVINSGVDKAQGDDDYGMREKKITVLTQ